VESSELTLLNASDLQGEEMSEKRSEILQYELTQLQKELQDLQNEQTKKSASGKKDTDLEAKIASKKREISSLQ
jgi:predicted RNase H-like nuclease (RuvC/YqgF family)